MAKFCTECGKEIASGVAFCTECGAKAPADPVPQTTETVTEATTPAAETWEETKVETPVQTAPAPTYQAQQPYAQPQTSYAPPAPDPANEVVGTGTYFGLMILFAIPVVGVIASIIVAFAPKNKSLKNYARAMLIWSIITLVIAGLFIALISLLTNSLTNHINQANGGQFGGFGDFFGQFSESAIQ